MASIINASTAGVGGVITTADNTGILNIQTAGTTAITVSASQNVGVGTTSPAVKLDIYGTGGALSAINPPLQVWDTTALAANIGGGIAFGGNYTGTTKTNWAGIAGLKENATDGQYGGYLAFYTRAHGAGNVERMRLDSSGNLGLGTTSPAQKLGIVSATGYQMRIGADQSFQSYDIGRSTSSGYLQFYGNQNTATGFLFGGVDGTRMTIDASGNLLVGTTSADPITSQVNGISLGSDQIIRTCVNNVPAAAFSRRGTDGTLIAFHRNVTAVGSISVTASATAYNTSSDYRLKENIAPMVGALDTVAQLKPVTYNWKVDGSDGQGFIAHELAKVVPDCVSGEKDAVDEDGNPVYQGIDTSFLVATLVAAIQELKAEIDLLKGAK